MRISVIVIGFVSASALIVACALVRTSAAPSGAGAPTTNVSKPRLLLDADPSKDQLNVGFECDAPTETLLEMTTVPGLAKPTYIHNMSKKTRAVSSMTITNAMSLTLVQGAPADKQVGIRVSLFARDWGSNDAYELIDSKLVDIRK